MCVSAMPKWNPMVTEAKALGMQTKLRGLVYQRFEPPILAAREVFVEAVAYIIPHDESIVFHLDTIKGDWYGTPTPRDQSRSELEYSMSFMYMKPLGPNKTLFKFINNANPHLDFIPDALVEWGMRATSVPFL
jgi:hypothetical protein